MSPKEILSQIRNGLSVRIEVPERYSPIRTDHDTQTIENAVRTRLIPRLCFATNPSVGTRQRADAAEDAVRIIDGLSRLGCGVAFSPGLQISSPLGSTVLVQDEDQKPIEQIWAPPFKSQRIFAFSCPDCKDIADPANKHGRILPNSKPDRIIRR